ncbi:MAG TPA: hypothetical protein VHD69_01870 [Candidatus Paceibacterota bacterium]|nr:hypothetical protein [Candidatus Paceibacterota bacterium]
MKTKTLFFVSAALLVLMSGCVGSARLTSGEMSVVYVGTNAYEGVVKTPFGGKGAFTHGSDVIIVSNDSSDPDVRVDFYENNRLVWDNIGPGDIRSFYPASAFRNKPVAFKSVVYTIEKKDGMTSKKIVADPIVRILEINSSYAPFTVSWSIRKYGTEIQQQRMYSYY